jgi:hypothetical protein
VIHALPGPEDDEFCVRATAAEVTDDPAVRALAGAVVVTSGVGGMIESVSRDPLFEFGLMQVDVALARHRPARHPCDSPAMASHLMKGWRARE